MLKILFYFSLLLAIVNESCAAPSGLLSEPFVQADLLQGANLNNLVVSGERQAKPKEALGNGWIVGPYNQGIFICDSTNGGFPPGNNPGIRTAVRLNVNEVPGSVYHPLGQLTQGKQYTISWYDTVNHYKGNTHVDQYTVRVAVNFNGDVDGRNGGTETLFVTGDPWTPRKLIFTPTATDYFYLSFKGKISNLKRGALISMVTVSDA